MSKTNSGSSSKKQSFNALLLKQSSQSEQDELNSVRYSYENYFPGYLNNQSSQPNNQSEQTRMHQSKDRHMLEQLERNFIFTADMAQNQEKKRQTQNQRYFISADKTNKKDSSNSFITQEQSPGSSPNSNPSILTSHQDSGANFSPLNEDSKLKSSSQEQSNSDNKLSEVAQLYEEQIKAMIPQIHEHLSVESRKKYQKAFQEKANLYRENSRKSYYQKIQQQVDGIKQNIDSNVHRKLKQMARLKQQIAEIKKNKAKSKVTALTEEQKLQLIQKTVEGIFESDRLLSEVKERLKDKVQERVHLILSKDMENQLEKCQSEIQEKIGDERQEFREQRKIFWKNKSEKELQQLAAEYQSLKQKKSYMDSVLKSKQAEKSKYFKKQEQSFQKAAQIAQVKKQIKQLEAQLFKNASITSQHPKHSTSIKSNSRQKIR